jgi:hypothetical protein
MAQINADVPGIVASMRPLHYAPSFTAGSLMGTTQISICVICVHLRLFYLRNQRLGRSDSLPAPNQTAQILQLRL